MQQMPPRRTKLNSQMPAAAMREAQDGGGCPKREITPPTKKGRWLASGPSLGRKRPRRAAVTRTRYRTKDTCHRASQNARGKSRIVNLVSNFPFGGRTCRDAATRTVRPTVPRQSLDAEAVLGRC